MNPWTIDGIIRECGGASAVAVALGLTPSAVLKMKRNGIADRHWSALICLSNAAFGPSDLYTANEAVRSDVPKEVA